MECDPKDWKLYRKKLPGWQEAYMERLVWEYSEILNEEGKASDKFWALEKRVSRDKGRPGVIVDLRRGDMAMQLLTMLQDGAITMDDLKDFSPELQAFLRCMLQRG